MPLVPPPRGRWSSRAAREPNPEHRSGRQRGASVDIPNDCRPGRTAADSPAPGRRFELAAGRGEVRGRRKSPLAIVSRSRLRNGPVGMTASTARDRECFDHAATAAPPTSQRTATISTAAGEDGRRSADVAARRPPGGDRVRNGSGPRASVGRQRQPTRRPHTTRGTAGSPSIHDRGATCDEQAPPRSRRTTRRRKNPDGIRQAHMMISASKIRSTMKRAPDRYANELPR